MVVSLCVTPATDCRPERDTQQQQQKKKAWKKECNFEKNAPDCIAAKHNIS